MYLAKDSGPLPRMAIQIKTQVESIDVESSEADRTDIVGRAILSNKARLGLCQSMWSQCPGWVNLAPLTSRGLAGLSQA